MKKITVPTMLGCILLLLLTFTESSEVQAQAATSPPPFFELKEGDRVVFLGNSLFEDDLQYGYLEFLLTTRYPDRNISFRNLGWSGDTVFGEARNYYTSPPTDYELLVQQLTNAKPTVVFLAYGANESIAGEEGIGRFKQGLNKLLDKIDELGAEPILLSTIPQLPSEFPVNLDERNEILRIYSSAIAQVAADRKKLFIDVFKPFQELKQKEELSIDGVHLNEKGYFHLAAVLEEGLQLPSQDWSVNIDVADQKLESADSASKVAINKDQLHFTLQEEFLPLPLPDDSLNNMENTRKLKVQGLKRGYYILAIDGIQVATAHAKDWANGIAIEQGPPISQSTQLRNLIFKKNELFFHQYRPQNRTYIIGFRSYEQGRHKKGLEELGVIIEWLEGQIGMTRSPKSNVYQLTRIK